MKKKWKRNRKQYSPREKHDYHFDCMGSPARHGIKFGSPRSAYSWGFHGGWTGRNNIDMFDDYGERSKEAYRRGYRNGGKEKLKLVYKD